MILILDSNILIAALMREGHIRKLIATLPFPLFFPEIFLEEIRKYEVTILQKSGLDKLSYDELLRTLLQHVTILPNELLENNLFEAEKVMKHIDVKDAPLIAAAFAVEDSIIWSDDPDLKRQIEIRSVTTQEVSTLLSA